MINLSSGNKDFTVRIIKKDSSVVLSIAHAGKTTECVLTDYVHDSVTGRVSFAVGERRMSFMIAQASLQDWRVYAVGGCLPYQFQHHRFKINQADSTPAFFAAQKDVQQKNATQLISPLAGRVSSVLVQPGQTVSKHQPLLFIDAMKMENEICADQDAVVKNVFIRPGDVIQPNHVLIEFFREGEGYGTSQSVDAASSI